MMSAKKKKVYWFKLDSEGHCGHVKDVIDPKQAKLLGAVGRSKGEIPYEIFQCRVCGYIYCGRLPISYYIEQVG